MQARFLLGLAVLMMMVPTFLYVAGPLRRPLMVDGDRLEARACPDCQGKGCRRCSKTGQIEFLIPGPNRPTEIIAHVYAPSSEAPVAKAEVDVVTSAGTRRLQTDEQGRFGIMLPPGKYGLKISSGQGKLDDQMVVEPLKDAVPADRDLTFTKKHVPIDLK